MDLIAPSFTMSGNGGGNSALTISALTLSAQSGASAALICPTFTFAASGSDTTDANAAKLKMPSFVQAAYGGATGAPTAPAFTAAGTGTVTATGQAALSAPSFVISATGRVSATAGAALTLGTPSSWNYNVVGYSGAVLSVTLPSGTITATGTTGAVGGATLTLPLFELTATGTVNELSFAELTAPAFATVSTGRAALVMPEGTLSIIGTAVVAVTYEAYAVNLNHTPRRGEEPIDEMTHFTNYPFDKIVRYKNSYFGMNATGLYLLEGTTDDGAAIPWSFQTALMDFGTPQQKTLEMAYFGGRLGPAATVELIVGEAATESYVYTTPLDSTAQNYRQPFGRGLKARYYAVAASGVDEVTLDTITFNVTNMTRRI